MTTTEYRCKNDRRRLAVLTRLNPDGSPILNGIDYLEVSADQKTVFVHLIHKSSGQPLTEDNIQIDGGDRLQQVRVESVRAVADVLAVRVQAPGDFSSYTLRLVRSSLSTDPPDGFDSQLSQVDFLFRVAELSEFDCQPPSEKVEKAPPPPAIDYLSKDYASFRQLMFDRLAVTLPQWKTPNPADMGVVLVELVAYAADHLSYYQDAVATEAYLGTARRRVSVRRHARLLDYFLHDGCNARAWVAFQVSKQGDGKTLPGPTPDRPGTPLLTRGIDLPLVLNDRQFETALNVGSQVFETLHDLTLRRAFNEIPFYTWGDEQCTLPAGATRATLQDRGGGLRQFLQVGLLLLLEEVRGLLTGLAVDADPAHRHVVRLTTVRESYDPLFDVSVVEVGWAIEDALPFPLVLSTVIDDRPATNLSVARGNVVLVDHGQSQEEALPLVPDGRYRPRLRKGPLTQQGYVRDRQKRWVLFNPEAGAASALQWQLRDVRPRIELREGNGFLRWRPQWDLLNSDRFAREFVVESEDDGRAYLRFGDNVLGRHPDPGTRLTATYRVGNGSSGNVGAGAIAHLYSPRGEWTGCFEESVPVTLEDPAPAPIRNPLPARGGADPEPIEQVRLDAPQAFRTQQRAVTEADYGAIAQRFPGVRKALATRRWTGSWYTLFITVDREGGRPIDAAFKHALREFLEAFRLTGHDLEIEAPRFVPLELVLKIRVKPDYFQSQVKEALLATFSNAVLLDGPLGFFHPDNFSFGQPVYLSRVIATAMQVAGVQSVEITAPETRFQRWGLPAQGELAAGLISFGRLEIAQLDNDPNAPERGRLNFVMEGGL